MKKLFSTYKADIKVAKARGGQYWTNIVGCILKEAADDLGDAEANHLIRECGLIKDGWQEETIETQ